MSNDLFAIIKKIYRETGQYPAKKQLQKLVYLIQANGVDLGYEYGIHFYGPYSEGLSHDLLGLCVSGLINFQLNGQRHEIISYASNVKMTLPPDSEKLVDNIINEYSNATLHELELVTTAHFVAVNIGGSEDDIYDGVVRIKGDKNTGSQIRAAIRDLERNFSGNVYC